MTTQKSTQTTPQPSHYAPVFQWPEPTPPAAPPEPEKPDQSANLLFAGAFAGAILSGLVVWQIALNAYPVEAIQDLRAENSQLTNRAQQSESTLANVGELVCR